MTHVPGGAGGVPGGPDPSRGADGPPSGDGSRTTARGLWLHESGTGPLVVLVHGAMDRSGGMLRARRLLYHDHRIIRYDRRGYGRSKLAAPSDDFRVQVDDLADILDGRPAVIAGHSFGGVIGLALAETRPELVRAVLAYEAPMSWEPWWPHGSSRLPDQSPEDAAEWFLRRMIGDRTWERLPRSVRAERRSEGPALVADLRSVRAPAPVPYRAERVTVPVLAAFGGAARDHHRRAAKELAERVPHGTLREVPGADHGIHLSMPEAFAGLVREAVELADAAAAAG
ncbi:MAG TPA: alpha/beta hydrolase [Acidimicrobiales bacterium]